jgi:hypothetical protein
MKDFQSELNHVVQGFVSQITELARRAAVDTLESALGHSNGKAGSLRLTASRGGKRSSSDIERLAETFHSYVAKHPGLRIEQINKELGTNTKDLALPIRKLIADGEIKTKGKKRSTTYLAAK